MGHHCIACSQPPATTVAQHVQSQYAPRDTVHHSITLYAAREHCALPPITLYRLATSALHQHITATLASSAPLYKPQLHKAQTRLYYPLCKGLTNWRPPWGFDFGTPYPTQVKSRVGESEDLARCEQQGENGAVNQPTKGRKKKQVANDQGKNHQEQDEQDKEKHNEAGKEMEEQLKWKPKKFVHPFTDDIISVEIPKLKMPGPLDKYDGTTDPDAHIKAYRAAMLYAGATGEVMCRAFHSTLKEDAQLWFGELKRRSISSFEDLAEEFSNYFATCKKIRRTTHYLKNVVQDEEKGESLKKFLHRFVAECKKIPGLKFEVALHYLEENVRNELFLISVTKKPPTSYTDMINRASKFMAIEEEQNDRGRNVAGIINVISGGIVKGTKAEPQTKKKQTRAEAVIPIEICVTTDRVDKERSSSEEENQAALKVNLDLAEEERDIASIKTAAYRQKAALAHNRKVRQRKLDVGDLVLREATLARTDPTEGKLAANWEGPYRPPHIVTEAHANQSMKKILGTLKTALFIHFNQKAYSGRAFAPVLAKKASRKPTVAGLRARSREKSDQKAYSGRASAPVLAKKASRKPTVAGLRTRSREKSEQKAYSGKAPRPFSRKKRAESLQWQGIHARSREKSEQKATVAGLRARSRKNKKNKQQTDYSGASRPSPKKPRNTKERLHKC
ncbi:gag-pol polyprotein [Senna tora]|uniref:Gag-pol polyprotein n=1 Tax=Senna tora TaxID=362788 RepID=A0A835CEB9_9FABA|nr:gag-pol polyprotein [Senna tora]